jgi:hypothetical protein
MVVSTGEEREAMMGDIALRIVALLMIGLGTWLVVACVRAYAAARKRKTLAAAPTDDLLRDLPGGVSGAVSGEMSGVRVLAFSSEDCRPCHTLQRPALARLLDQRKGQVSVIEIDAPGAPTLTRRYAVLTVPTTVILDASGKARAVNYGFAPTTKLLAQVDEALAMQTLSA